jgi:Domain of unknown function (DUF5615)
MVKLLLDELYAVKLARALRGQGIDAVTVAEPGMAGRSDADVFAAATTGHTRWSPRTSATSPGFAPSMSPRAGITTAC